MIRFGMILVFIMLIGCQTEETNADNYLLDYSNTYGDVDEYESFCEMYQQREFSEDICYEYNINQAMKNGVYTVEEMKQIKKRWLESQ